LTTGSLIKSNVELDEKGEVEEEKDAVEGVVATRMWMHLYQYHQHNLCEEMKSPIKDS